MAPDCSVVQSSTSHNKPSLEKGCIVRRNKVKEDDSNKIKKIHTVFFNRAGW